MTNGESSFKIISRKYCGNDFKGGLFLNRQYNIFTQVVGGRAPSDPSMTERMMLMSTYEEFMVILTTASLVVAILNMKK